jgi:hypothetical protein
MHLCSLHSTYIAVTMPMTMWVFPDVVPLITFTFPFEFTKQHYTFEQRMKMGT